MHWAHDHLLINRFSVIGLPGALSKRVVVMILVLSPATTANINLTANLGGQIRPAEIRVDAGSRADPCTG